MLKIVQSQDLSNRYYGYFIVYRNKFGRTVAGPILSVQTVGHKAVPEGVSKLKLFLSIVDGWVVHRPDFGIRCYMVKIPNFVWNILTRLGFYTSPEGLIW